MTISQFLLLSTLILISTESRSESVVQQSQSPPAFVWLNNEYGLNGLVPKPWTNIKVQKKEISVLGRKIKFSNSFLPSQIWSNNTPLFSYKPESIFKINGNNFNGIDFKNFIAKSNNHTVIINSNYNQNEFTINAQTHIDFDGFIKIDINIIPKEPIIINEFFIEIPFHTMIAKNFSKYSAYDFDRQRIKKNTTLENTGKIKKDKEIRFEFNPAIWIGNNDVGLEWISESNINNYQKSKDFTHSIKNSNNHTLFKTIFIDKNIKTQKTINYSFAFLPTPSKPQRVDLSKAYLTSLPPKKAIQKNNTYKDLIMLYFGHWTKIPAEYPGLPSPSKNNLNSYNKLINTLINNNIKYIPYSSMYILPSTIPELRVYENDWNSSPKRRGSILWQKTLKTKLAVQPVTLESKTIRDFLLFQHIKAMKNSNIAGIYFDVSQFWDLEFTKERYINSKTFSLNKKKNITYYPMFSHRKFIQRYWKAVKEIDKDFIIIHHTGSRTPKFSMTYADILVSGESLHQFFENGKLRTLPYGRKRKYIRPYKYIPNYFALDNRAIEGLGNAQNGAHSMLLPQVSRFNEDYLKRNPRKFILWSRSAIATAFQHKSLIWHAKIDEETLDVFVSALLRFDYFSFKHKEINTPANKALSSFNFNERVVTKLLKDNNEFLLFISNKTENTITQNLHIDDFGSKAFTSVHNAETIQPIKFRKHIFSVTVPKNDYLLVHVSVKNP